MAKAACSRDEREYAQKSSGARRKEPRISRNLLDGVETSLRRHLLTDIPSRKRKHTTEKPTKRPRRVFQAQRQHKNTVTVIVPKRVQCCFKKWSTTTGLGEIGGRFPVASETAFGFQSLHNKCWQVLWDTIWGKLILVSRVIRYVGKRISVSKMTDIGL